MLGQAGGQGGLPLPEVLRRLGDFAAAREAAGACAYREVTVVEELDQAGAVLGQEERTYQAEARGVEVTRRERTSVTPSGAPLSDLLVEPKGARGRKPAPSPFLPSMRPQFRFALEPGPAAGLLKVTLEPLKPDVERVRGEVWVRASDARLEELRVAPSKVPLLLESLSLRMQFDDTRCGRLPVVVESEGVGRAVLVDGVRFRTRTRLSAHAPKR